MSEGELTADHQHHSGDPWMGPQSVQYVDLRYLPYELAAGIEANEPRIPAGAERHPIWSLGAIEDRGGIEPTAWWIVAPELAAILTPRDDIVRACSSKPHLLGQCHVLRLEPLGLKQKDIQSRDGEPQFICHASAWIRLERTSVPGHQDSRSIRLRQEKRLGDCLDMRALDPRGLEDQSRNQLDISELWLREIDLYLASRKLREGFGCR